MPINATTRKAGRMCTQILPRENKYRMYMNKYKDAKLATWNSRLQEIRELPRDLPREKFSPAGSPAGDNG